MSGEGLPSHAMRYFAHFYVAPPSTAQHLPANGRCWRCDLPTEHPLHLDPANPGLEAQRSIQETIDHARRLSQCASSTPAATKDDASPTSPPAS